MLKSVGVTYVIIGHSEQRTYFHETDETVNKKINATLAAGLLPIVCIGETLDERKSGKMETVVDTQTRAAFDGITKEDALKCTIAYEPVWAIGTGKVASPQQAQEVHVAVRGWLKKNVSEEVASKTRIIYGGSVNGTSLHRSHRPRGDQLQPVIVLRVGFRPRGPRSKGAWRDSERVSQ